MRSGRPKTALRAASLAYSSRGARCVAAQAGAAAFRPKRKRAGAARSQCETATCCSGDLEVALEQALTADRASPARAADQACHESSARSGQASCS